VRELGSYGTLLGAFAAAKRPETEFVMQPNETIVAFTDGVTDTVGPDGERFGIERLKETLRGAQNETPMTIRMRLIAALEDFQVGAQADDTAVVVMRYSGRAAARRSGELEQDLASTEPRRQIEQVS
jgi:serine phosphatase RsbU (regulator of sigma subunit)